MVVQLSEDLPLAPEPTARTVRGLLDRARAFPELTDKYRGLDGRTGHVELGDIPPLTADELRAALWSGIRSGLAIGTGTSLYFVGGTGARPSPALVPTDLFAPLIVRDWRPLGPQDILLNLCQPSRLWPVHDLVNALAREQGASIIPFGGLHSGNLLQWLDVLSGCGVTALAGDTPVIRELARLCLHTGQSMDWLRTVVWVGSGRDTTAAELAARAFPSARIWSLYGSVDAWAVGAGGPECPRGVFHPLAHQHIEIVDGEILVTTLDERAVSPLLRYRSGDTGEFIICSCRSHAPAIRLSGHLEDVLSFRGARFSRAEIVDLARSLDDVDDAEAVMVDSGLPTERLQLRVRMAAGVLVDRYQNEWIRECLLGNHLGLGRIAAEAPESVEVVAVAGLLEQLHA